jgi:hypothetical protein
MGTPQSAATKFAFRSAGLAGRLWDVGATRGDIGKIEPDVAGSIRLLQKPVLGSHGGCVHGSEANAPTFGARTQLSCVTLS